MPSDPLSSFRENLFAALEDRKSKFPDMETDDLVRLCHEEAPPLRWDKLGRVHWLGWWSDIPPTPEEIAVIREALSEWGAESYALEWRKNREKNKTSEILLQHQVPESWSAAERGQWYLLKSSRGQSRGVFLDQREQRTWVRKSSAGKRVLNLFAYTCGFSVAAALGGAQSVHSVDVSKSYLNWGRVNFKLNHLSEENHKFYAWDCFEFLAYAKKKKLQYDLIVCDPPSFGRSVQGVFQIASDLPRLMEACLSQLARKGALLLTTNYEGWSPDQFADQLKGLGPKITVDLQAVREGEDFNSQEPILKGALIRQSSQA